MKEPKAAKIFFRENAMYPIEVIHYETGLVTLAERKNVFNTVSIKNVEFDFTGFTRQDQDSFLERFKT